MRTVIVDGDVSYPATSGKRLRTLNLMLKLAARHQITYIARADLDHPDTKRAERYLRDHGVEPILVHDPLKKKAGFLFYCRLAKNLLSRLPYSVASHRSRILWDVVTRYAMNHPVDLWQFEWAPYMETLDHSFRVPRLVIAHNVDTLIWQRYYENSQDFFRRIFLKQQWKKFARYEGQAYFEATRVVAVSPDDADLIRTKFNMPFVDVVENGIDREFFSQTKGAHDPYRILFLGALDWRPNLDAIDQFIDRVFPAILREVPFARLMVVGRQPPPGLVQKLKNTPNVELHADVPDVRPFLGEAGLMAVPLRIGGGSRLKILEALAAGLPVVSTRVGAEGLNLRPGIDFVQAEEHEMASAIIRAMRAPGQLRQTAVNGRQVVREQYDWDVLAHKLEKSWEACVEGFQLQRQEPALANTIQGMDKTYRG